MADQEDIDLLRTYVDEPTVDNWTDEALSGLIDEIGLESAAARIWRQKQARFSKLVDVTEAGASRKMSQAFAHAQKMSEYWAGVAGEDAAPSGTRVHKIVRS